MSKDYYHILQVHEQAEQEVIEAAFKRLARKYHPDKDSSSGATAKMQELNEAYQVLRDPNKRADYDRGRQKSESSQGKQENRANEQKRNQQERQTEEQAERERVEKRRREQEARKQQEREVEEKRKREDERKYEDKVRLEALNKKRLRYSLTAVSAVIAIVLFIVLTTIAYVSFQSPEPANTTVTAPSRPHSVTIWTPRTSLRQQANDKSKSLKVLNKDERLEFLSSQYQSEGWNNVKHANSGMIGWVHGKDVFPNY